MKSALFRSTAALLALTAAQATLRAQGPGPLQPPQAPLGNPVTAAKANLGKSLFWDEQLSSTRAVACATCHVPGMGGSDPRSLLGSPEATHPGADGVLGTADDVTGSPGVTRSFADGSYDFAAAFGLDPQVTGRKTPTMINAAYAPTLFWDGRADDTLVDPETGQIVIVAGAALETQVLGPPLSDVEMSHVGRDWPEVVDRINESAPLALSPSIPAALEAWIDGRSYPELFTEAFGTQDVTPVRIAFAMATYQRTLFSDATPLDAVLGGNPGALTPLENQGRQLFNQLACNNCHIGNLLTNQNFHYIGVRPVNDDLGRFEVTGQFPDRGAFRTPSLRNVELRAPYFHDGSKATLMDVVEFYDRGGDFNAPNKDPRIVPLGLSQNQKNALVAFLGRPLTDPRVENETAPFDRPLLYSESNRVPVEVGPGSPGSGGFTPDVVALEPPVAGNPSFTVGVQNGLGGAPAVLEYLLLPSSPTGPALVPDRLLGVSISRRVPITLGGVGSGAGFGSVNLQIPSSAAGFEVVGRWIVSDRSAAGGASTSPWFRAMVF